jgi:hypothetical protein
MEDLTYEELVTVVRSMGYRQMDPVDHPHLFGKPWGYNLILINMEDGKILQAVRLSTGKTKVEHTDELASDSLEEDIMDFESYTVEPSAGCGWRGFPFKDQT